MDESTAEAMQATTELVTPTIPERATIEHKGRPMKAAIRLSKVAPRIFAALRANPPEWLPEFDQFISQTAGAKPSQTFRHQAANEWDCFVMGAALAFGYFDNLLRGDDDAKPPSPVADPGVGAVETAREVLDSAGGDESDDAGVDVGDGEVADAPRSEPSLIVDAHGTPGAASFQILGPTGEPLVEGLK